MKNFGRLVVAAAVMACVGLALATPAPAQASLRGYVSVYLDPSTGAYGYGYGPTRSGTRSRARRECQGDCQEVVWVRNGCVALYSGGGNYGYAFAATLESAKRRAKNKLDVRYPKRLVARCAPQG